MNKISIAHQQVNYHSKNSVKQKGKAATKIFDKLCRVLQNRNSYCFQLLKQFILFSSDDDTIIVPYKYSRFEMERGMDYLESAYGLNLKLTLGKAFHDIRSCSEKKKVYQNNLNVHRLVKVYDKAIKIKKHSLLSDAFAALVHFVQGQKTFRREGNENRNKYEMSEQRRGWWHRQYEEMPESRNKAKRLSELRSRNPAFFKQSKQEKKQTFQSSKMQIVEQRKQRQFENNSWRRDIDDRQSYEEHIYYHNQNNPRKMSKSMNRYQPIHKQYMKEIVDSSLQKNATVMKQTNGIAQQQTAEKRKIDNYDSFEVKRGRDQSTIISNLHNFEHGDSNGMQNIIVIRSSSHLKREPDRYIRVPITSERVKIVELIPEKSKRRKNNVSYTAQRRSNSFDIHKTNKQYGQTFTAKKIVNGNRNCEESLKYDWENINDFQKQSANNFHQCFDCNFCHIVEEMEIYRLQRYTAKPLHII